ncbi:hypothetical protein BDF20DRAFT_868770 [Mycotypha africana]|uniref:uncharacterized protein n=1 Tax=Mycotypha africana TaxID=64632 RepID=UPI0023007266|nr:uncharacterized protein BDF20DRAFT_868770 [Mycotypha africana]KAI8979307.1 hypothetical protein BDF20DRAFT_868770 [Mycotypha africana]
MILTRFTSLKISSFRYGSMRSKVPKVQTNKWIQALLPVCYGDTALAKRELQWMKEAVTLKHSGDKLKSVGTLSRKEQKQLDEFVEQRVLKQKPLQYILGSQPFCELDIISRSPTLIPR